MLSVHSQSPEVSTSLLGKQLFIINNQHFSKFFLFFPLTFETSSDCIPYIENLWIMLIWPKIVIKHVKGF
jgi:hypothetical protein